ncbi:MAG: DUF2726 domain-containing protein [Clostridia bacterium]|nr:DUF2726 domain-containing protein [Clostridia bacterium]
MKESEILICHYNNGKWCDVTKNVELFSAENNAWRVKFKSSDKFYYISSRNMRVFDKPKEVEFVDLYYKQSPCLNVKKLLLFNDKVYKIFYNNGYTCFTSPQEIKIIKDTLKEDEKAAGVMAYYRKVVKETAKTEEDKFMISQFDDISYVNNDSVLSLYLKGKLAKSKEKLEIPIVCPFGLNMSQADALKMAFENRISIIEGPPGTGKTQTILNILSNAVIRGKSVAVVSNNNSATDNVFEKLEKYGYSFICAQLGNADNVNRFFEECDSSIPKMQKENVDIDKLNKLYSNLPSYFEKENNKKQILSMIDALDLEYKHFLSDNESFDFDEYKFKNINVLPNNVQEVIVKLKEKEKIGFFERLFIKIKLRVKTKFFKIDKDKEILLLQNLYYLTKKNYLKKQIEEIDKYMKDESLEDKTNDFRDLSNKYFKNKLIEMYSNKNRSYYDRSNYKKCFSDFIKNYPVILSSTYALAKCSPKDYLFDYLIVDESSQVNMASAILSMQIAINIIVVGDIKQLPQIDDSTFNQRNEQLLKKFNVSKAYSYQGNSIMSSLLSLYGDSIPKQMLKEHYRCAPEIINFCNEEFYDNQLIVYTKPKKNVTSMKVIKTVAGNFARKNPDGSGQYNQREIDEIENLINTESMEDIGIITPYRYQAKLIQDKFGNKVDASTIHKFQGREKKSIIFSSVVNDVNDFVDNDNLINVAVSRAVDNFILITSDKVANSKTGVLADLINYITYHEDFGKMDESKIKSIYDILYSDYEEELNKFRKNHPSKDFDTENITKELLKSILSDTKYKSLWFRMHVSLSDFVRNNNHDLTDEEYKFYINPKAHVDFLIYNKMSRKPVCVIEVDGVAFHEQQEKQKERDVKKDSILKKSGIPILRLRTNESNEEKRVKDFIDFQIN